MERVTAWYDQWRDWDQSPQPNPSWDEAVFAAAARQLLDKIRRELGPDYAIIDEEFSKKPATPKRLQRGWHSVLFEDCGSPQRANASLRVARERRVLPKAPPELNAMDHLWRHGKGRGLANRPIQSLDEAAASAYRYRLDRRRQERRRQAGILSGHGW